MFRKLHKLLEISIGLVKPLGSVFSDSDSNSDSDSDSDETGK